MTSFFIHFFCILKISKRSLCRRFTSGKPNLNYDLSHAFFEILNNHFRHLSLELFYNFESIFSSFSCVSQTSMTKLLTISLVDFKTLGRFIWKPFNTRKPMLSDCYRSRTEPFRRCKRVIFFFQKNTQHFNA